MWLLVLVFDTAENSTYLSPAPVQAWLLLLVALLKLSTLPVPGPSLVCSALSSSVSKLCYESLIWPLRLHAHLPTLQFCPLGAPVACLKSFYESLCYIAAGSKSY